jgi:lipoyl(octanoyl) transferase
VRPCAARWIGRIDYPAAIALQDDCARRLKDGAGGERLLLLEHPPVITLGRNARPEDVLIDPARLRARGIAVERCDRGGQVTYHGPGQLVGYPVIDLSPDRRDVARYLRDLEEVLIRTLARFGVAAGRVAGLTGVWVGQEKIASIGVHLSRWVTTHGFALNVATDLDAFGWIVPCGIRSRGVTSMERILGTAPRLDVVAAALLPEFARVFDRTLVAEPAGADTPRPGLPAREAC